MNNKKTKLSLLVLGTSAIGAATLALVASQPEVTEKEQVTITNTQIEPTEALNEPTAQINKDTSSVIASVSKNSPVEGSPLNPSVEVVPNKYLTEFDAQADKAQTGANIQLHLPADFQTLDIENCWHETGIWEIHFRLTNSEVVEVIGTFNTLEQLEVISLTVRTLQVNDIDIPLNGFDVTMFKKGENWLFNLAKGNIDTAFNIAPEFAAEMKGQLNNDFNTDAGDEVVTEVIEPVKEPVSWRESFGVGDLVISEAPKYTFPKVKPVKVYVAPKIEVPAQNLGVFASYTDKFDGFFNDDPYDARNWLILEPVDKSLNHNKINLNNEVQYPHGYYAQTIQGTTYYLEYASGELGQEKYRLCIRGTQYPIYLNPETGAELDTSNPEGEEFSKGSHAKVYEIARKHQALKSQNV